MDDLIREVKRKKQRMQIILNIRGFKQNNNKNIDFTRYL